MRSITLHLTESDLDRAEKDFHRKYEMELKNSAKISPVKIIERSDRIV